MIVRAIARKTGVPIRNAQVSIYGEMTSPHHMSLYRRNLHESSVGRYKGPYTFIMQGQWTVHIVVRSKREGASTATLPINIHG